jgi:urease accessory protein
MKKPALLFLALLTILALVPSAAPAHTGVGNTTGFSDGFMHPITGLDHVLAMVMVGVLAWQLGGRALGLAPATFVLVMAIGGAFGAAGIGVPFVEAGIAPSVVVLGVIVAFGVSSPVAVAVALVGLFAIFHGHAHGAEMPEAAAATVYAFGFILGTALPHAVGMGLGLLTGRIGERRGPAMVRAGGVAAALAGVAILAGLI